MNDTIDRQLDEEGSEMTVKRAFLVATAKNEAPYFLEWVAHHLEVGGLVLDRGDQKCTSFSRMTATT